MTRVASEEARSAAEWVAVEARAAAVTAVAEESVMAGAAPAALARVEAAVVAQARGMAADSVGLVVRLAVPMVGRRRRSSRLVWRL